MWDEPAAVKWEMGWPSQFCLIPPALRSPSIWGWSYKQLLLGRKRWGHTSSSLWPMVLTEPQVNFLRSQWWLHVPEGEVCETRLEVGPLFPEFSWLLFRPWSRIELFVVIKYPVAGSWNGGYTEKTTTTKKKPTPKQSKTNANISSIQPRGKKNQCLRLIGFQNSTH